MDLKTKKIIDTAPIMKFITDGLNNPDKLEAFGYDAIEILAELEFADTIDAVEVVRCKDCKYYENDECANVYIYMSNGAHLYTDPDDFCSYGERREENAAD